MSEERVERRLHYACVVITAKVERRMKSYCGKVGEFINFVNSEIRKSFARSVREHERHVSDMKSGCIQDSRQKEPLCEKKVLFSNQILGNRESTLVFASRSQGYKVELHKLRFQSTRGQGYRIP